MNKPLILISSDSNACSPNLPGAARELRSPAAYSRAVAIAGGVPVIGGEQCAAELAEICDALLLSGGPDIEPELFGEKLLNASVKCDEPRTKYEYALLDEFLKQGKPIFGICRGSQVMNVYFGGTMYQDLVEQKNWNHMVPHMRHPVTAEEGSILHKLFGKEFNVNSTHHQALKDVAKDIKVTAWSENGQLIEAWEHEKLPVFAVQFHPERLTNIMWDERTPDFAPLFDYFINLVKEHKNNK